VQQHILGVAEHAVLSGRRWHSWRTPP